MSRTCGHSAVVLRDPEGNEVCIVQEWFGRVARSHPVIVCGRRDLVSADVFNPLRLATFCGFIERSIRSISWMGTLGRPRISWPHCVLVK